MAGSTVCSFLFQNLRSHDLVPYVEEQSGDGCEPLDVDHGQGVWEVTLAGAHEEQPGGSESAVEGWKNNNASNSSIDSNNSRVQELWASKRGTPGSLFHVSTTFLVSIRAVLI